MRKMIKRPRYRRGDIQNNEIDLGIIGELQEIPQTTTGSSGSGWGDDQSTGEVSGLGALTNDTFGDIHREWIALYDEATEGEW